jgi:hypothetical protein
MGLQQPLRRLGEVHDCEGLSVNLADFQRISGLRIAEARSLLTAVPPQPSGAFYLAGYAVECALKAVICKGYDTHEWPERKFVLDCHTHDLNSLCKLAELETDRDSQFKGNKAFFDYWRIVTDWDENSRYREIDMITAEELFEAITEPTNGVLPWIMNHW